MEDKISVEVIHQYLVKDVPTYFYGGHIVDDDNISRGFVVSKIVEDLKSDVVPKITGEDRIWIISDSSCISHVVLASDNALIIAGSDTNSLPYAATLSWDDAGYIVIQPILLAESMNDIDAITLFKAPMYGDNQSLCVILGTAEHADNYSVPIISRIGDDLTTHHYSYLSPELNENEILVASPTIVSDGVSLFIGGDIVNTTLGSKFIESVIIKMSGEFEILKRVSVVHTQRVAVLSLNVNSQNKLEVFLEEYHSGKIVKTIVSLDTLIEEFDEQRDTSVKNKFNITTMGKATIRDTPMFVYGGFIEDDKGIRCGFIATKVVDDSGEVEYTLGDDDDITIVPGSSIISTLSILENALLIGGESHDTKGYAAHLGLDSADLTIAPITLDENILSVNKILKFTDDPNSSYALIGKATGQDGWITSIVSVIGSDYQTVKSVIMKDEDNENLMPVTFCDMTVCDDTIFVCGVINPSELMPRGVGIVLKLNANLEKINAISFTSDTAEAVIIRKMTEVDDNLNIMCDVISNGQRGVITKVLDKDLNEVIQEPSGSSILTDETYISPPNE